ncbi:AAA family ATPase [Candidatus Woesearchaeota archaeon]|nr:AAA family ATPase [Candidatus Woesearchaeota archaeon]
MMIIVTGTPGSGKTSVAKLIAEKKGFEYVDLGVFAKKKGLVVDRDEINNCDVIDEDKLSGVVRKEFVNKDVVLDSHLSHHISSEIIDLCIVTKCDIKVLKKRLEKRSYSEEKVRENLDSEIFDVCRIEASEKGHEPIVVWTDKKNVEEQLKTLKLI